MASQRSPRLIDALNRILALLILRISLAGIDDLETTDVGGDGI